MSLGISEYFCVSDKDINAACMRGMYLTWHAHVALGYEIVCVHCRWHVDWARHPAHRWRFSPRLGMPSKMQPTGMDGTSGLDFNWLMMFWWVPTWMARPLSYAKMLVWPSKCSAMFLTCTNPRDSLLDNAYTISYTPRGCATDYGWARKSLTCAFSRGSSWGQVLLVDCQLFSCCWQLVCCCIDYNKLSFIHALVLQERSTLHVVWCKLSWLHTLRMYVLFSASEWAQESRLFPVFTVIYLAAYRTSCSRRRRWARKLPSTSKWDACCFTRSTAPWRDSPVLFANASITAWQIYSCATHAWSKKQCVRGRLW